MNPYFKFVVVGDDGVGKTCFQIVFNSKMFPNDYIPTVFESYAYTVNKQSKTIQFSLWDTVGDQNYDILRQLSYPGADVFLMCYAIDNKASFDRLITKYLPEVRKHCPTIPYIFVGLKEDLRNLSQSVVSDIDVENIIQQENPQAHIVCSALNNFNITLVINTLIDVALKQNQLQ
ncbi:Rac/Rho-like_protein [Hexamita inflata]|uniref:Rac/Rho-like protein n=1 Tax=Hexamita inflata TaxID=28002 RepID=A0AA86VUI4_9EUKA|nr:Rac/Rho-like protein [Hexamita inflata]